MARKTEPESEIRQITVAEISRQLREISKQRQSLAVELCEIENARPSGVADQPLSDHSKAVHRRMKEMLNGHATAILALPPDVTRSQELRVDIDACDGIIKVLERSDIVARAAEAVQWAEDHRAEWNELCREVTLAVVRLDALERRARDLRDQAGGVFAGHLAMCQFVGTGRSIAEIPAEELIAASLSEGITTKSEIGRAQNVE